MYVEYNGRVFWTSPHESDPELLILNAHKRSVLEEVLDSIELQGVAEERDFDDLYIYAKGDRTHHYEMVLDRTTLALYFQFEAFHHLERKGPYLAE